MLAGATLRVTGDGSVGRDALVAGQTISLAGPVGRNVLAGAGSLTIDSSVGGDVTAEVGEVTVTSSGSIDGDLDYTSRAASRRARTSGGTDHASRADDGLDTTRAESGARRFLGRARMDPGPHRCAAPRHRRSPPRAGRCSGRVRRACSASLVEPGYRLRAAVGSVAGGSRRLLLGPPCGRVVDRIRLARGCLAAGVGRDDRGRSRTWQDRPEMDACAVASCVCDGARHHRHLGRWSGAVHRLAARVCCSHDRDRCDCPCAVGSHRSNATTRRAGLCSPAACSTVLRAASANACCTGSTARAT